MEKRDIHPSVYILNSEWVLRPAFTDRNMRFSCFFAIPPCFATSHLKTEKKRENALQANAGSYTNVVEKI